MYIQTRVPNLMTEAVSPLSLSLSGRWAVLTEQTGRFLTWLCQVLVITPVSDKPAPGFLASVRITLVPALIMPIPNLTSRTWSCGVFHRTFQNYLKEQRRQDLHVLAWSSYAGHWASLSDAVVLCCVTGVVYKQCQAVQWQANCSLIETVCQRVQLLPGATSICLTSLFFLQMWAVAHNATRLWG